MSTVETASLASVKSEASPASRKKTALIALIAVAAIVTGYLVYESIFYVTTDNAQIRGYATLLSSKVSA